MPVLSLLCSEWEEVGHTGIKHRHQKAVRGVGRTFENRVLPLLFSNVRPTPLTAIG